MEKQSLLSTAELKHIADARAFSAGSLAGQMALVHGEAGVAIAKKMGVKLSDTAMLRESLERMTRTHLEIDRAATPEQISHVAKKALDRIKWLESTKKARSAFGKKMFREWMDAKKLAQEAAEGTPMRRDDKNLLLARAQELAAAPVEYWAWSFLGNKANKFLRELNRAAPSVYRAASNAWSSKTN